MKILVPLDGSPLAESILVHAGPLLDGGSEVHLLRVLEAGAPNEVQAEARRALDAARAALGARRELARVHVAHGPAAERILEAATTLGVDLIAMATHGRSGVTRLLRGSVAEAVLRGASVPVYLGNPAGIVARPEEARFPRILVPLDGSTDAEAILPLVGRFAGAWKADVVLAHVDAPGEAGTYSAGVAAQQAQGRAEVRLGRVREVLEASGVRTHVIGLYGDAATKIAEAAEQRDATVVAMATHGRTGLRRLQFGSVAEEVLRRCRTPLLMIRVGASARS